MKNKKVTYILLPAALLIWGIILYKVIFRENEDNTTFVAQTENVKEKIQIEQDTFTLQLDYPDPFLKNAEKTFPQQSANTVPAETQAKAAPKPVEKPVVFPALKYEGIVKHTAQGKTLVIININGKSKFVQTGETVDNIKLLQVYDDSIIVNYEKEYKTIRKK